MADAARRNAGNRKERQKAATMRVPRGQITVALHGQDTISEHKAQGLDSAIFEAESEFALSGELHDARDALAKLRRKHLG